MGFNDKDPSLVPNYEHYGATENTNYVEIENRAKEQELAEAQKVPVEWVIVLIFTAGIILTGIVIFFVIRYDRRRRQEREMELKFGSGSITSNSHLSASAAAQISSGEDRLEEIERGVVVQSWVAEVHHNQNTTSNKYLDDSEAKTEQDDSEDSAYSHCDKCPICRKAFETGDLVCSTRNANCRHAFHKSCMFNWLQYQTRCPVCNQEYLVDPSSANMADGAIMTV